MMEFYYMMHYVIYRWYRKHNEDQESSMVYIIICACFLGYQCFLINLILSYVQFYGFFSNT